MKKLANIYDTIDTSEYSVLVVDDDEEKVLKDERDLKAQGYKAYTAFSGEEAIEILRHQRIDILLMDYYMKGITGAEAIEIIREFDSEIIIILQTGYACDFPEQDMLESLNIQGYHDKTEGQRRLLSRVLSAARSCAQIRVLKNMVKEVNLAHETLKQMRENQWWLIEQIRLASLGQKMGTIFHDMSNALLGIEGSLEVINIGANRGIEEVESGEVSKEKLSKELVEIFSKIINKCQSCNARINYIKEMRSAIIAQSRPSNFDSSYKKDRFLIESILDKVKFFAEDDLIKFNCMLTINNSIDKEIEIEGSEINLMQVLNNLITNSAQAYNNGGNIDLVISRKDDFIEFIVKDTADGIPEEIQKKLFIETISTKKPNGSGIGIYASYLTIVNYFKGKMRIESVGGKGTNVYILVPYAKDNQ